MNGKATLPAGCQTPRPGLAHHMAQLTRLRDKQWLMSAQANDHTQQEGVKQSSRHERPSPSSAQQLGRGG